MGVGAWSQSLDDPAGSEPTLSSWPSPPVMHTGITQCVYLMSVTSVTRVWQFRAPVHVKSNGVYWLKGFLVFHGLIFKFFAFVVCDAQAKTRLLGLVN